VTYSRSTEPSIRKAGTGMGGGGTGLYVVVQNQLSAAPKGTEGDTMCLTEAVAKEWSFGNSEELISEKKQDPEG
jgi:hypothetical protein